MKKLLVAVILTTSLSSCFDIIDEITVKNDGSGEFKLTVNMSKSKSKIASIMLLETFRDYKVPSEEEVEVFINDLVVFLNESEGITGVMKTVDFEEFIFTLKFNFDSVQSINKAIENLTVRIAGKPESFSLRYDYDRTTKQFIRLYTPNKVDQQNYDKFEEEDKSMFNTAFYISICRFEQNITSCTNKKAKISKSGKAVMLRTPATDIMEGNSNLTYTIQLN